VLFGRMEGGMLLDGDVANGGTAIENLREERSNTGGDGVEDDLHAVRERVSSLKSIKTLQIDFR
jgi:hypothetical protein